MWFLRVAFLFFVLSATSCVASGQTSSFTWWDYRGGSFRKNHGLRIDLILASANLIEHIPESSVDITPRGWEKPSDHAPVSILIDT